MRLPQSSLRPLSVYKIHILTIGMVFVFLGILPVSAFASPQLASTPSNLRFGETIIGQTESLLVVVTNSGQATVTVSAITVSKTQFSVSNVSLPLTLSPGQSSELNISYTPTALGWTGGTVKLTSTVSNTPLVIDVGGTGVSTEALTASPSIVNFGTVTTGASATVPVVLTNNRNWKVTILAATIAGNGFSISGMAFPFILSPGKSATLNVTFSPQSAETNGGSIFFSGVAQTIPLSGTGTSAAPGQLTVSPAPLNFGNVPEKTTESLPITLSATGASVTVTSASSSSSQFALSGGSLPFTIAAGQSVSLNVAFTPQSSGLASGSLSFGSNASNSQANESLSGTGTVTPASVNLFWNSSSEAAGYNVYRSTAANGTYSKINPALEANTAYTDSTVSSGQTYYYEATAVNSAGQESARSTPAVQATVP